MTTRKRVSQACLPCGDKKIKCDGAQPVCGPCVTKQVKCSYGVSKRKSVYREPKSGNFGNDSPDSRASASLHPLSSRSSRSSLHTPHDRLRKPFIYQSGIPAEASSRLFSLYFEYIHPTWPILYKPLFSTIDFGYPSPKIPPALIYAIYAISASIEVSMSNQDQYLNARGNRKDVLDHQFLFEESLSLLYAEPGNLNPSYALNTINPSITNCQVLAILALQQHGIAKFSSAGNLSGLASIMAIDLRLNRSYSSGHPVENEIRTRLWWTLYVLDKMLAVKLARPALLRGEESDAPHPSLSESDEFELMPSNPVKLESSSMHIPAKMHTISGFHMTIGLAAISEKLSRQVYSVSARKRLRQDHAAAEEVRLAIWQGLEAWKQNISSTALQLDMNGLQDPVPSAITGHLMMCTLTIMLHRPFISTFLSHSDTHTTSNVFHPHTLCLQAANSICSILAKYASHIPGLSRDTIFSIFISASIFLHDLRAMDPNNTESKHRLKLCVHWLEDLSRDWRGSRQYSVSVTTPASAPNFLDHQNQQHLQQQDTSPSGTSGGTYIHNHLQNMNMSTSVPQPISGQNAPLSRMPYIAPELQQNTSNGMVQPVSIAPMDTTPTPATNQLSRTISQASGSQSQDWGFLNDFGDQNDAEAFWALDLGVIDLLLHRDKRAILN